MSSFEEGLANAFDDVRQALLHIRNIKFLQKTSECILSV